MASENPSRTSAPARPAVLGCALALLVALGALDYYTGYEISFAGFYLAPITLVTWYLNKRAGLVIAILSAVVWSWVDVVAGQQYSHPFIMYWNTLTRLAFYTVVLLLISQVKEKYEVAEQLALTDPLTGIANRRRFFLLTGMMLDSARRSGAPTTVAYVDIDGFKDINDHYGHHEGDEVLQRVARTMQHNARHADVVARLGGDEFVVLLPETDQAAARTVIARLQQALRAAVREQRYPLTFSIGVITYTAPPSSVTAMLQAADRLMYAVKRSGKNTVRYEQVDEWLGIDDHAPPTPFSAP